VTDCKWQTLEELRDEWLERYPGDADHPDLDQMVTAGYVQAGDKYILWRYYETPVLLLVP
jgi:hypothetical protein